MKFKMLIGQSYNKAEKVVDIPLEAADKKEITGWLDAGYNVTLEAVKDEEGETDDF